jgi:uncharacterized membrane protein
MTLLQSMPFPHAADAAEARPQVRRIHEGELRWALAEGWKDFRDRRGDVILLALIYPVVGLAAALATFNARLLPMLFPLAAGLSILGPAVAAGFYELARRREVGLEAGWRHFLDPLRGRSRAPLLALTAGLVALFAAWLAAAWLIYAATLGSEPAAGVGDFLRRLFTTPQGWTLIVVGNLVGFGFAAVTLVLSVVSFPMVVDRPVGAGAAVAASIRAAGANPRAMTLWGLRVAGLLLLGCLPGFVGLAVVLPLLGYATWRLYTRLIVR